MVSIDWDYPGQKLLGPEPMTPARFKALKIRKASAVRAADKDVAKMTDEEFDAILSEVVGEMSGEERIHLGDAYTHLAEEFNNAVLEEWAKERGVEDEDYSAMTDEEFDTILARIVGELSPSSLLGIGV